MYLFNSLRLLGLSERLIRLHWFGPMVYWVSLRVYIGPMFGMKIHRACHSINLYASATFSVDCSPFNPILLLLICPSNCSALGNVCLQLTAFLKCLLIDCHINDYETIRFRV